MGQKAGGGGGGTMTLLTSGFIRSYEAFTEVDGNTVLMKAGGTNHRIYIAPSILFNSERSFKAGDIFKIAFTIPDGLEYRVQIYQSSASQATVVSATGLMTIPNVGEASCYTNDAGSDVLTFTKTAGPAAGSFSQITIQPLRKSDGSTLAGATATVIVTGMSLNDQLIYGSVTPPSA